MLTGSFNMPQQVYVYIHVYWLINQAMKHCIQHLCIITFQLYTKLAGDASGMEIGKDSGTVYGLGPKPIICQGSLFK